MAKTQAEIILYQPTEAVKLEVRLEDETVWLNRQQMAILFARDVKTIGKHVNNALKEELATNSDTVGTPFPVVANFATTAQDGKTYQVEYYNLDVVLSVGYRVKSQRGIEFRRWANKVLKEYLLRGYSINHRLSDMEHRMDARWAAHEERLNSIDKKIDFFVKTSLPPVEGVFYDGQIFDAYKFVTDLIRTAKESIVLIDNYVDESVLLMLSKRKADVSATIYTKSINRQLQLDLERHNSQYSPIEVKPLARSHDRFMLIDGRDVYHIGASLKDLGKKMFAFSKMELPASVIMNVVQDV